MNPRWTGWRRWRTGRRLQSAQATLVQADLNDLPFAPRSFANYTDAALEAVVSRLYGGIHYPMSNERGFNLGQCVADRIIERIEL